MTLIKMLAAIQKKQTACHFKGEDIWFYPWVWCESSKKLIVAVNYTFQNLMKSPTYMAFFFYLFYAQ